MADFTVRIQLNGNPTWEHYKDLHEKMEAANYRRFIRGVDAAGNPGLWDLPDAEYDGSHTSWTAQQVRDDALRIANSVLPGAWCLVTQVAGRSWHTKKIA